jgi:hypothetical protein
MFYSQNALEPSQGMPDTQEALYSSLVLPHPIIFYLGSDIGHQYHPSQSTALTSSLVQTGQASTSFGKKHSLHLLGCMLSHHCLPLPLAPSSGGLTSQHSKVQIEKHLLADMKSRPHRRASSSMTTSPNKSLSSQNTGVALVPWGDYPRP